jgi:3',5'-cyclic-nucleotide phosphodiesterase
LATIADNRSQAGCGPLLVAGTKPTISVLRKHFFNGLLWPDFSKIPDEANAAIVYKILKPEEETIVAGYSVRAILVNHTIDCSAFIVKGPMGTIAYSGDTGPTDRLYELLNQEKDVRALLMEVSFPNSEARLARVSGHHTPETLAKDLQKLVAPKEIPTLLYHIKPCFQAEVEKECAALKGLNLTVMGLGDKFRF